MLGAFQLSRSSLCRAEAVPAVLCAQLDKQVTLEVLQQFISVRTCVTSSGSDVNTSAHSASKHWTAVKQHAPLTY